MNAPTSAAVRAGLTPVRLLVWGATDEDRARAVDDARSHHLMYGHPIAVVEYVDEPIPASGSSFAVAHHATYGRTWAAYKLAGDAAAMPTEGDPCTC